MTTTTTSQPNHPTRPPPSSPTTSSPNAPTTPPSSGQSPHTGSAPSPAGRRTRQAASHTQPAHSPSTVSKPTPHSPSSATPPGTSPANTSEKTGGWAGVRDSAHVSLGARRPPVGGLRSGAAGRACFFVGACWLLLVGPRVARVGYASRASRWASRHRGLHRVKLCAPARLHPTSRVCRVAPLGACALPVAL